jgi:hypothetical protein
MSDDGNDEPATVEIPAIEVDELLAEAIDRSAESIADRPACDAELVQIPNYEEKNRTEILVHLASRHTILQKELRKLRRRRRD